MIFQLCHAYYSKGTYEVSLIGAKNGCPFCKARTEKSVLLGSEIVLLAGLGVGRSFTIVEKSSYGDDWLCREIIEKPDGLFNISPLSDLYINLPVPAIPIWALSLSVEDNCMIDDVLMRVVAHRPHFGTEKFDLKHLSHLIAFCWLHRLPVDSSELCDLLEAHGHPNSMRTETVATIDRGLNVLLYANGKAPIARRKMKPFEVFKYFPNTRSAEIKGLQNWVYGRPVKYSCYL
jgi:hypothetical protein